MRDVQGNPLPNQTVRLSVSDDNGDKGTIAGGEVLEGKTNAQGHLTATFLKTAEAEGKVVVRAELLAANGEVLREESITLTLNQAAGGIYLPMVVHNP